MVTPRILSCGEVLWDLFPEGPRFGGAPANFACHAALLGAQVSMFSAIGNDDMGAKALAILNRFRVGTSLVRSIAHAPTGTVGVSLDGAGKPSFEIHAHSAWDQLSWDGQSHLVLSAYDAIYFGTLSQRSAISRAAIRDVVGHAKTRGIRCILDINLRPPHYDYALLRESIALASVLKLSDEELPEVAAACEVSLGASPEVTLQTLHRRFELECVAKTRGAHGAVMVTRSGTIVQPGIPTKVVDTVGAGDAFAAALVFGFLRGDPGPEILRFACTTASAACGHAGGVPNLESDPDKN